MDKARDAVARDGDHDNRHDNRHDDRHDDVLSSVAVIKPATASARLRAAREMQGLTTADIAARTRITLRHVEALDRGDLAALPGRPYVLGFVRSYARVVGLNEADLSALARSELDAVAAPPAPRAVHQYDVDDPAKTPSRSVIWLALLLFVAVLLAGGVLWRSYYAPAADLPSLIQPDPAPAAAPSKPAANPAPTAAGPVVFTAREDDIWVKFYDGQGKQLLQKQLKLGESYTVPADAVGPMLWTGRPDALAITIGGQSVPPLSDHRGIVHMPVTAQALLARAQPAPAPANTPTAVGSNIGTSPVAGPVVARPPHRRVHQDSPDSAASAGADAPAAVAPAPAAVQSAPPASAPTPGAAQ